MISGCGCTGAYHKNGLALIVSIPGIGGRARALSLNLHLVSATLASFGLDKFAVVDLGKRCEVSSVDL